MSDKVHKHKLGNKLLFRPWHMMLEEQQRDEILREPSKKDLTAKPKPKSQEVEHTYPSYPKMAKNLGGALVRVAKAAVSGEEIKVDKTQKEERHLICKGCIHYHDPADRCKLCGCVMSVKTTLKTESCPAGKW